MKHLPKYAYGSIAVLVLIFAAAGYYFFYFIKTPEYSIKIIADAYKSHDVHKFNQHLDVESILNAYFDDAMAKDPDIQKDPFAIALMPAMKQMIIAKVKEEINQSVAGAPPEFPSAKQEKAPVSTESSDHIIHSITKGTSVKSVSAKKLDDHTADIYLKISNQKTGKEAELTLRAKELKDGTWRIYEVPGLYQLITDTQKD